MLKRNNFLVGRDFSANVKRLGVITFRIAMILSALRIQEEGDITSPIICSDTDYNTAMTIVLCLERHAIEVFKKQPNHNLKGDKLKFFDALPNDFDRKTYGYS